MKIRSLLFVALLLVCGVALSGQKNHTLDWKSGASPNVFDQMEKQTDESKRLSAAELAALRQQREARLAELNRELADVIRTASDLQERLKTLDPNTTISVELHQQGKQLEDFARKIRKQISTL